LYRRNIVEREVIKLDVMKTYHSAIATLLIACIALYGPLVSGFVHSIADGLMSAHSHRELFQPHLISTAFHAGQHAESMQLYFLTPTTPPFSKEVMGNIEKVVLSDFKGAFDTVKNTVVPEHVEGTVASSVAESLAGTARGAASRCAASMLGLTGGYSTACNRPSSVSGFKSAVVEGTFTVVHSYSFM
jgi:hypothetical protein